MANIRKVNILGFREFCIVYLTIPGERMPVFTSLAIQLLKTPLGDITLRPQVKSTTCPGINACMQQVTHSFTYSVTIAAWAFSYAESVSSI